MSISTRGVPNVHLLIALVAALAVVVTSCAELEEFARQQQQQGRPIFGQPQQPPTVVQPPVIVQPPAQPPQPPVTPPPPPPQPPVVVQPPQPPVVVQPPEPPQPLPPQPIEPPEAPDVWVDTVAFDPNRVSAREVGGRWFLMTDEATLMSFEGDEAGARRALNVLRFYRMDAQCSLGRPTPLFQYYLVNGRAPNGPMPGELSLPLDAARLDVAQVDDRWLLVQGNVWLLDFGLGEAEARAALGIIRQYGFTHICFVGQPQPVMVYFRAGGAGGQSPYVQARLAADTPCYSGPLPATLGFRGSIAVGQPCEVRYTFVRGDGVAGPMYALRFDQPGAAEVATELPVAQAGAGSLTLRVLAPALVESSPAYFEVQPAAQPLVQAKVLAQPAVYMGRLPATIRFHGRILAGQACDVSYAFVRSDGTMGPVETLRFPRPGVRDVSDDWTLRRNTVGWAAIQILSPVEVLSSVAPFEVRSGGHHHIQVSLAADPSLYCGPLPAQVDFRGLIAASRPCEVQYVFVRNDGATSPIHRLRFDRPGAREVRTRWAVPWEGTGWQVLRVVAPARVESEQAAFEVRSAAQPHVRAALAANPDVHPGPLPATVQFRGTIWAGQPCDVSYVFRRSTGETSRVHTLRFPHRGAREVVDAWTLHQDFAGWETIRILAPVQVESPRAGFTVKAHLPPIMVTAALAADPPHYVGPAPALVQLRGTIRASRPCEVRYALVRSDGVHAQHHVLRFDRPGQQEVVIPQRFTRDFAGWAALRVTAPVAVESPQAPFTVDIRTLPRIRATLAAEPAVHPGPLPAAIRFKGTITADQPCEVRYAFVRHDNTMDTPRVLRFNAPGSRDVTDVLTVRQPGSGWQALRILAPVALDSNHAAYEVKIAPPAGVHATLRADPPKYEGPAPGAIAFKGTIRTTQPCDVRYVFVRSDGTTSAPQTLRFDRPGIQAVEETRQFAADARGWEMLRVLAPVAAESARADFAVDIEKPAKVDADLRAVPPKYEGPAPGSITFRGTIRVSQPCRVRYAFVHSDGTTSAPQALRFDRPGVQQVEETRQFAADARGWTKLRVLAPDEVNSDPANFEVNILQAVEVRASLKAHPAKHAGPPPAAIRFDGAIKVTQPCEVRYTFVRSDGVAVPPKTLRFDRAGAKDVDYDLRLTREGSGWVLLRVLAPVAADSERAEYEVEFGKPKPKISVELTADPPEYEGPAPATIQLNGTVRADQACLVQCSLARSDSPAAQTRTVRFDGPGRQDVAFTLRFTRDARGWAQLRVLTPAPAESARVQFVVKIQEHPKGKDIPKEKDKPKEKEKGKEEEPPAQANVQATLSAEPDKYAGRLPTLIRFRGSISVTAPCEVRYVIVHSDNSVTPERSLRFLRAGDKPVADIWRVDQPLSGWALIRILAPVRAESAKAQFEVRRGGK